MRRSQSWHSAALLLLLSTFAVSCKHAAAPPPPPPAAAASAPSAPALPAPTIALRADSVTILRGGSLTLTWDARNAATVDIEPAIGRVTPVGNGSRQVSPASSVTYIATATAADGRVAMDNIRITVNEPPPPAAPAGSGAGNVTPSPSPNLTVSQLFDRSMQPIIFDYDKSDIREDQKSKLQTAATYLKANTTIRLTVEGHADERGSEEYNLALGDRRANAVKQYFVTQGVAENRIDSVSYGEERPVCSLQTEDCYAQNRRAAFRINP